MKILLATLSGFVVTVAVFTGGAFTAVSFLSAKPEPERRPHVDTAGIWTIEPVKVNTDQQDYERIPARTIAQPAGSSPQAGTASHDTDDPGETETLIDFTTTAALPARPDPGAEPGIDPQIAAAHIAWCSNRYRSYSVEDNSYNPYRGGRRECISPYLEAIGSYENAEDFFEEEYAEPTLLANSAYAGAMPGSGISQEHVRDCFNRYRSYRVEDNTYQPYGGGPRRQCQ